jgi:hypothetical protein
MRIPENPISAMALLWHLVYALALSSVVAAAVLSRNQDSKDKKVAAKNPIGSRRGFRNQ